MVRSRWLVIVIEGVAFLAFSGALAGQDQLPVAHPECSFFGPQRERFVADALKAAGGARGIHALSTMTEAVTRSLAYVPGGSRTYTFDQTQAGSIDSYILAALQANHITPALPTT